MFRRKLIMSFLGAVAIQINVGINQVSAQPNSGVDSSIPSYKKAEKLEGTLSSMGSDTLNNVMTLWAEKFRLLYPLVNIEVEGKGSGTAPPALIEGVAQIGPMSRPMKDSELEQFEKKFGYRPTQFRVALDALAVFVHKDNPLKGISLEQVDSIFSKSRRQGAKAETTSWGQLGLANQWKDKPISIYGRNSASGTYGFFKEVVLKNGDFKDTVKEQPGSASVVQGIASDKLAIGYSGIGYQTGDVRALPLVDEGESDEEADFVTPSIDHVIDGSYPLARYLFIYINKSPQNTLSPLLNEFLKFILSKEGQEIVIKDGYFSIPPEIALEESKKLSK